MDRNSQQESEQAMPTIEYEIVSHGVDNSQYFQGCGIAFTKFDSVVTGCGDSYKEALEDAIEQMACEGAPIPAELERKGEQASAKRTVPASWEDCYHYVSIRWKEVEDNA